MAAELRRVCDKRFSVRGADVPFYRIDYLLVWYRPGSVREFVSVSHQCTKGLRRLQNVLPNCFR